MSPPCGAVCSSVIRKNSPASQETNSENVAVRVAARLWPSVLELRSPGGHYCDRNTRPPQSHFALSIRVESCPGHSHLPACLLPISP